MPLSAGVPFRSFGFLFQTQTRPRLDADSQLGWYFSGVFLGRHSVPPVSGVVSGISQIRGTRWRGTRSGAAAVRAVRRVDRDAPRTSPQLQKTLSPQNSHPGERAGGGKPGGEVLQGVVWMTPDECALGVRVLES